jgi:predicted metalloprotease with PDZ domain
VPERQPAAIETTAYVTVSEAIEDANRRRATFLGVRFDRENGRLVITAVDDGAPRSTRLVSLADRVGALGGSLEVAATTLRAELPCE